MGLKSDRLEFPKKQYLKRIFNIGEDWEMPKSPELLILRGYRKQARPRLCNIEYEGCSGDTTFLKLLGR